jgi:hypothetical protein
MTEKRALQQKLWNLAHPEKLKEYQRRHHATHKEVRNLQSRMWKAGNPTRVRNHQRAYHARHKTARLLKHKQWMLANPAAVRRLSRLYYLRHKEQIRIKNQKTLQINRQNPEWLEKERARQRAVKARWRAEHPEEHKQRLREFYKKDPKRYVGQHQEWLTKHPDYDRERLAKWRAEHPEEARQKSRKFMQIWRENNPEIAQLASRNSARKRRRFKYASLGQHTDAELTILWIEQKQLCAYCHVRMLIKHGSPRSRNEEHKIPLSRGGSDDISNICWACFTCNSRKRQRTAEEFLALLHA